MLSGGSVSPLPPEHPRTKRILRTTCRTNLGTERSRGVPLLENEPENSGHPRVEKLPVRASLGKRAGTRATRPRAWSSACWIALRGRAALFDPAQARGPAASCPISKSLQTCLVIAVNPVAQRLAVHPAKPRRLLAAEAIEHHGNGQDARRLPGVRRSLGRCTQIAGTHIRSSNRNPMGDAVRAAEEFLRAAARIAPVLMSWGSAWGAVPAQGARRVF